MTVKELKAKLANLPDGIPVVMSKDGEGNDFSPLSTVEAGMFRAETTWSGEVRMPAGALTDEARERGYSEEDVGKEEDGFVPAVVLWPTN